MFNYIIDEHTTALIPAKQIDHETLIIERETSCLYQEPAMNIIEATCKADWSSYSIRRNMIIDKICYIQKTPIPVNVSKRIVAFPTHSPEHIDCVWIILNPHTKLWQNGNQYELILNENETIPLSASVHTIKSQLQRARNVYSLLP